MSLSACFAGKGGEPIVYLDLRYTLEGDYADSLHLLSVWDDLHAVSALQGIVNRDRPRLYIEYVETNGRSIDAYWWQKYRQPGEWLEGRDTLRMQTVEEVVRHFRPLLRGVVAYDANVASTSNVASTVAGVDDLLPLRYDIRHSSLYQRLTGGADGLRVKVWLVRRDGTSLFEGHGTVPDTSRPSTGSSKCDAYVWMTEHYLKNGRVDGLYAGYYQDQFWRTCAGNAPRNHHTLTNHDFFVSRRAFFFDLSPWEDEATDDPHQPVGTDHATLCELLASAHEARGQKAPCYIGGFPAWAYKYTRHAGGRHEDVETEWHFAELISRYMAFKDADAIGYGALANASFWQHFPLKKRYSQRWTDKAELKSKGFLTKDGKVDTTRHYMLVYVGDYDASSWISQRTPDLWDNAERGRHPMMWCVSPVLAERVPHVMHNFRTTASPNDYFAASDNGAGYLMPGVVERYGQPGDIDCWRLHCLKYYRRWGLSVTGFIIDGTGPAMGSEALDAYAEFSPNGIVPQKASHLSLHARMPVLASGPDLPQADAREAARDVVAYIHGQSSIPFHWFRIILRSPQWYNEMVEEVERLDPTIILVDAPTFFELARIYAGE